MLSFSRGDTVTWLGQPDGDYCIEAVVVKRTPKRVTIRVVRPSSSIPEVKTVDPRSLRAGFTGPEVRW